MDNITGLLTTVLSIIGKALVVYLIVMIALYILYIVGAWKTFVKAGESGWKSIIPFYNTYITYKISWKAYMYWIYLAVGIINIITMRMDSSFAGVIASIASIASFVLIVMRNYKLSKSFGHGVGFTIGLTFLINIFMPILGLGSSQYIGPQE